MHDLIDIGINLTHAQFAPDRPEVVRRAREAGVGRMIVTGTSLESSRAAVELARTQPGVLFATAGIHPHDSGRAGASDVGEIVSLAGAPEVLALGECGLDFDRDFSPRPAQERVFEAQLEAACALGLPLFLHERAAHGRFLEILSRHRPRLGPAVVHCFTGDARALEAYLAQDLHIGVTGWICDERRGAGLRSLVGKIPAGRLMLETDAPYLLPPAARGRTRRNEPAFLPFVLEAVAHASGRPPDQVARETTLTAERFFGLAGPGRSAGVPRG